MTGSPACAVLTTVLGFLRISCLCGTGLKGSPACAVLPAVLGFLRASCQCRAELTGRYNNSVLHL